LLVELEKAADRLARYSEAHDAARAIDVGDRVSRDEAAVAREETGAHRESVRHIGERPVHRALDLADHATPVVGDEETSRVHEIQRESGHVLNLFPDC
jgi:hypothetical protein